MEKRILTIARWPLGGIRTYMKYVYRDLPPDFCLTVLAASTHEDEALKSDVAANGAHLVLCKGNPSLIGLMFKVMLEILRGRYDLIQSQGFTSAIVAFPATVVFRVPHVITIHGVVEERYFSGRFASIKKCLLGWILGQATVIYAVSNDILEHVYEVFPRLRASGTRKIVIHNGVDIERFNAEKVTPRMVRHELCVGEDVFLFGFLGRFMQQKGFNFLIDAVQSLSSEGITKFCVLAVGSGDYLQYYQKVIRERNLENFFYFLPFSNDVAELYAGLDAVVMPSLWEACPLQPMEALCMGVPLITSDCIGMRETVAGTPAVVFPSRDAKALAAAMLKFMGSQNREAFSKFIPFARERFNVSRTSLAFQCLVGEIVND